jgi:hypothetical protein
MNEKKNVRRIFEKELFQKLVKKPRELKKLYGAN